MTSKVVKVEQVLGPPGGEGNHNPLERSKTSQTVSTELLAYGTDSSLLPISREGNPTKVKSILSRHPI